MRWTILFLVMLVMTGCASTREERHERIGKWFKDWWTCAQGGDSYQSSNLPSPQDERDDIQWLNTKIGNTNELNVPRGR